jgi:hypothetical protein
VVKQVAGRVENLKPFKPRQSGNPGGRPKKDLASIIAREVFAENPEASPVTLQVRIEITTFPSSFGAALTGA